MSPLEFHDLTVSYRQKPVLYGIDACFPTGALVGIVGPNGAGKSTLLKAGMGLVPMSSGWVRFFGEPLAKVVRRVGYVPQRNAVDWDFPVNVRDVVMMGRYGRLGLFRRPGKLDRRIVEDSMERMGIGNLGSRQISELSGGQQQRVFLARGLAQQADLYLLDEPFAGVDAATEEAIVVLLRELKQQGRTVVVVHHDLGTVERYYDHVLLLNMRLIGFGPTQEVFNVENLRQAYGGQLNVLSRLALQRARTTEG
ncbi:MAG: metal ABC transporter ATP-binding protein [Verrucomicrobia bacterium]|nr:metal ABC transporter ATP-binding protein [Verrucomicrobiota bacterium]